MTLVSSPALRIASCDGLSTRRDRNRPAVGDTGQVVEFQRARSTQQRAARRRAILGAAASMLAEMPVAQISLNELARRVGLAQPDVLRYFESREAVLLELLDAAFQQWLDALATAAPGTVDAEAGVPERSEQLAAGLAGSLAARPVLCDLIAAQAAVLERNVSPLVAAEFKRTAVRGTQSLARLVLGAVPELGEAAAFRFAGAAVRSAGAIWTHTHPSAAMLTAYEADPVLAAMRLDFTASLRDLLAVLLAGLLARSHRDGGPPPELSRGAGVAVADPDGHVEDPQQAGAGR
jgi:AcrR family transcriptional regulator